MIEYTQERFRDLEDRVRRFNKNLINSTRRERK